MVLLPWVLEAGVGAWIVKRAASTDYRPGVRPLQSNEAGCEIPTVARTSHNLATPASQTSYARQPRLTIHNPCPHEGGEQANLRSPHTDRSIPDWTSRSN